jgi:hypothetical protein
LENTLQKEGSLCYAVIGTPFVDKCHIVLDLKWRSIEELGWCTMSLTCIPENKSNTRE